ncbi:Minichromosome maintenance protein MCM [Infirmifilum uzonense]|uniref:DNA helicase n=1 Tax=Infirmifilum uzonense TaxID=1550241 RepID=A0A0F7FIC5_9CREN|nr:minichromosome maintenance protein MCM [Infirmifilum uzonense]AKG39152.1 Minichromosome maintenance protein MCM [Infirmifilum uzonense]
MAGQVIVQSIPLVERLTEFLKDFRAPDGREKYREMIRRMSAENSVSLVVDFEDILLYDKTLADTLTETPSVFLEAASKAVYEVMSVENPEYAQRVRDFHVRIRKLPEALHVKIRDVRAKHLGKLLAIEGIVTKISPVKHELIVGVFRCKTCGHEQEVKQESEGFTKPTVCPRCEEEGRRSQGFTLVIEKSKFVDIQKFVLQEKPEELPPGQLPRSIDVVVREDLADIVRPGDRATVIGFMRVEEDKKLLKNTPPIFHPYIEANYIEVATKESLDVEITPEDEKKILELSRREDIEELILNSIAPSIYGYKEIKRAVALLLFGGVPKIYPDGVRVRGDIHILLIGDPGTAKSQILRYVASLAPRGIYTSGKGASAAGLTAAVVREKNSGEFYLEAGALVLADGGVACIDEFDKMEARDRVSIHEAMEQQTVSIAKAGIVATLNARASILAAANPVFGRYIPGKNISENIDLPVTILSRFDLIFVIKDTPNRERDRELAQYVVDFHGETYPEALSHTVPADLLKKYVAYARKNIRPKLSAEAKSKIVEYYVAMRSKSEDPNSPIAITPRQLEALIRLAEARARLHLRPVVIEEDAETAIELMEFFLRNVGIDTQTKTIDIDTIMTGQPKSKREKIITILDTIRHLVKENNGECVEIKTVIEELTSRGIDESMVREVIESFVREGELMTPRRECIKPVNI